MVVSIDVGCKIEFHTTYWRVKEDEWWGKSRILVRGLLVLPEGIAAKEAGWVDWERSRFWGGLNTLWFSRSPAPILPRFSLNQAPSTGLRYTLSYNIYIRKQQHGRRQGQTNGNGEEGESGEFGWCYARKYEEESGAHATKSFRKNDKRWVQAVHHKPGRRTEHSRHAGTIREIPA